MISTLLVLSPSDGLAVFTRIWLVVSSNKQPFLLQLPPSRKWGLQLHVTIHKNLVKPQSCSATGSSPHRRAP